MQIFFILKAKTKDSFNILDRILASWTVGETIKRISFYSIEYIIIWSQSGFAIASKMEQFKKKHAANPFQSMVIINN